MLPLGAGGLIALLAGLGFYKVRQRKKAADLDSSFLESRLNPESFFGESGGQNIDTNDNPVTGSSMIYSPSQLDAVDDVDPVAEADVYLAYGRDLQAEEILKDAQRNNPNRLAIHHKLLEIYAKRADTKAFEAIATLAFNLTNGTGADWEQVCEKGLSIDPDNALYLPGGQPHAVANANTSPMDIDATGSLSHTGADEIQAEFQPSTTDLDLDLDFSIDESIPEPSISLPTLPEPAEPPASPQDGAIDFSIDPLPSLSMEPLSFEVPEPVPAPSAPDELMPMDNSLDFSIPEPPAPSVPDAFDKTQTLTETPAPDVPSQADAGMLEFDLGSLSLDLGEEPITESGALPNAIENPLETKLALAEEFKAIGDDDGARALIEEVIAEAAGDIKAKAQRALKQL
ncbi:MAG: pilus assembly protein FimV [Comamonadaceae bacterium]|nr:MAG: pilus assembly protein FimV [Comamonadaceae bacterium]